MRATSKLSFPLKTMKKFKFQFFVSYWGGPFSRFLEELVPNTSLLSKGSLLLESQRVTSQHFTEPSLYRLS